MPVPDFSPGEVLTAAAMDSIGLWKVAEGTLSGSTTNFVGCFSSTYKNYRVIIDDVKLSAAGDIYIQYLTTGTTPVAGNNYYWSYAGLTSGGATQSSNAAAASGGYLGWSTTGAGGHGGVTIDITNPNVAIQTLTGGVSFYLLGSLGAYASRSGSAVWDTTATFTGFRITTLTAVTMTSGNVKIYGYRN